MEEKLKQLLEELNKEKAFATTCCEQYNRLNNSIPMAYNSGKEYAFYLCIKKLEKILK